MDRIGVYSTAAANASHLESVDLFVERMRFALWQLVLREYVRNRSVRFMFKKKTTPEHRQLFDYLKRFSAREKSALRRYLGAVYKKHCKDELKGASACVVANIAGEVDRHIDIMTDAVS